MKEKQSDEVLMGRVQKGEDEAFNELNRRYWKMVFSIIYRVLEGDVGTPREVANDLAQDTFIKALLKCHTYDESAGKFLPWLLRIATNTTIDFMRNRRESWWRSLPSLDEPIEDEDEEGEGTTKGELVPLPGLADDEVALVRVCLDRLKPEERAALVMHHVEKRTLQETADKLGIEGSGRHVTMGRFIKQTETKFKRLYGRLYEGGNQT